MYHSLIFPHLILFPMYTRSLVYAQITCACTCTCGSLTACFMHLHVYMYIKQTPFSHHFPSFFIIFLPHTSLHSLPLPLIIRSGLATSTQCSTHLCHSTARCSLLPLFRFANIVDFPALSRPSSSSVASLQCSTRQSSQHSKRPYRHLVLRLK